MSDTKWPRFAVEVPGRGLMQCEAMTPFQSIDASEAVDGLSDSAAGWCRIGIMIGLSWYGAPNVDADAGLAKYGQSVVEALHKDGWRQQEMATFARLIGEAMLANEVEESVARADFSEAREAAAG